MRAPPRSRREVVVRGREGLHARPASRLVAEARRFPCTITIVREGVRASAKEIMDVLLLAAPRGAVLTLEAEGERAEEALAALEALFASAFGLGE